MSDMAEARRNDPNAAQAVASDPAHSAWVTANAGSGKTKVLIDRVARLLLGRREDMGTEPDPSRILCLTYTRAAAANMKNKLFTRLGGWALMDDEKLAEQLVELGHPEPQAADLKRARRLFAQALETPGGLRIQTIHSFCEALLRRFPLEAGVSPHFTLADEVQSRLLQGESLESMLERMLDEPQGAKRNAVLRVMEEAGEGGLVPLAQAVIARRALFAGALDALHARIDAALGLAAGTDPVADARAALEAAVPRKRIRALAELFAEAGGKHETKAAGPILDALAAEDAEALEEALAFAVLTAKGEPRATSRFPVKAVKEADPEAEATILDLQEALARLADARARVEVAARSRALATFAKRLLERLEAEKRARVTLDFDDLIRLAGDLLQVQAARDWVRYKLDGGVDHILVDEAQDTSPDQWRVIGSIAEEFYAGEGARDVHRTLFVVGDEKQSIYSFQGADPGQMAQTRARFEALTEGAGQRMVAPALLHSFRSAPSVLGFVDHVFADEAARDGLDASGEAPRHLAWREGRPGRVDLWPVVAPPEKPEEGEWWEPLDQPAADAPEVRLAQAIAGEVARWVAPGGERLPARGRTMRPGDVMILMRRRGALADAIIRALKQRGVPVAGEDRMVLDEQLAVRDLLALCRFALLPGDDLTLATVLRSPVVGLNEPTLFALAYDRGGRRLWDVLVERREEAAFAPAHALLADMLARADFLRPYEFLERALAHHGARRRLLGRLGPEAEDPIDELLAQALAYEERDVPTLQGFVALMETARFEVKREMEQGRDEVRVMTVHGAKGLEANVVILPDTTGLPPAETAGVFALDGAPVWARRKGEDDERVAGLREARRDASLKEYRRLLYVAMTRARDRLVICAHRGAREVDGGAWFPLAKQAMEAEGAPIDTPLLDDAGDPVKGWSIEAGGEVIDAEPERAGEAGPGALEFGLDAPVRTERKPKAPVAPSRLGQGVASPVEPVPLPVEEAEEVEASSAERGVAMHRLLERLARLPREMRALDGMRGLPEGGEEMLERVLTLLDDPASAWMFGPRSMAEVRLAGPVDALGGRAVSGAIDRLVRREDGSLDVIDFKSGRPPADGTTPEPYLRQLAVYRAAVAEIYPGEAVRAHLVWLDAGRTDALDEDALAGALARARRELESKP